MDALVPQRAASAALGEAAPADRRPSVTRLAAGLQLRIGAAEPLAGLCLPLALLLARHLRFDAADPLWPDRDRLILAPQAAPLGQEAARLLGSSQDFFHVQGLALGAACGLALAERMLAARFGRSLVDHRVWVLGTGADLATGPVQEAGCLTGAWRLGRLTMIQLVSESDTAGLSGFAGHGWAVRRVRAGDAGDIAAAMSAALRSLKPTLIAVVRADAAGHHPPRRIDPDGAALPKPEVEAAWQAAGRRASGLRRAWLKRLARHAGRIEFERALSGRRPVRWHAALSEPVGLLPPGQPGVSTACTIRHVLPGLLPGLPEMAWLPGAPLWKLPASQTEPPTARGEPAGRLGHGVSAALCGLALHGGLLPLAAHGLAEIDAIRPALRAAALARLQTVHILIEPEIPCPGAGQRAGLRSLRNLMVFRPADAAEALECLELALRHTSGPSALLLSELRVPLLSDRPARTRSARGGYVVAEPSRPREATLIASGPELHVARQAGLLLDRAGVPTALVCLPCWDLFAQQDESWQASVLGAAPRIAIEPGGGFGWERWCGPHGRFLPMDDAAEAMGCAADLARAAHRVADAVLQHLRGPPGQ